MQLFCPASLLLQMGADALFEDPGRRSSSVGVTVNPVRIQRIQDFGGLEEVGQRLLDAERKKVRMGKRGWGLTREAGGTPRGLGAHLEG